MNKRHYEHTLPNIRGSLSNTYKKGRGCLRQVLEEDAALRRARMSVKKNGRTYFSVPPLNLGHAATSSV